MIHSRYFNRSVFFSLALVACCALPFTATAQSSESIQIQPAVIEERIEPGRVYSYSIRVTNVSDVEKIFYISSQDITGLDDAGLPLFSDRGEATEYELSSWVTLSQESVTLAPNQSERVAFTVTVPQSASPGSHFGGIFLDARPPRQRSTGSGIGMKIGTIMSLRVAGEAREDAQLREFSTGRIIYSVPTVDFLVRVANLGNVLIRPYGIIEISDMRGEKVGIMKVNDNGAAVFPQSDKPYEAVWEYDRVAFGRYSAVVSLNYGEGDQRTISAVTSFWVLPLKPLLIVFGTVFGTLLLMYIMIRRYIKKKIREMSGGRGGGELYARRNQSAAPKLITITLGVVLLSMAGLVVLFLLFA
jgi:hypothetical protein